MGSVDLYGRGPWMTEEAHETVQVTCPPFSVRRVPLPRSSAWSRLVPVSHAAGEPSPAPLVRTRRSTTQPALLRLPSTSPTNRPLTGPRAQEPSENKKKSCTTGRSLYKKRKRSLACGPPFIARGSAHRSAPFSAPPPFEAFREASRKGACPSLRPPHIHQS